MEPAPAGVEVVVKLATPLEFNPTEPSVATPFLNTTAPLGITGVADVTVAE